VLQPPLAVSAARGLTTVGGSALLLGSVFLAVLVLWLGFTVYGVGLGSSPVGMVQFLSLPPLHALVDGQSLVEGRAGTPFLLGFGAALLAFRSLMTSFWVSATRERLMTVRGGKPDVRNAVRRALKGFPSVLVIELGYLAVPLVMLGVISAVLGQQIAGLAFIAWLMAGLYLFMFAEVVAVSEGVGVRAAVQMSMRTARVPGREHALFVFGYFLLFIFLTIATPSAGVVRATPPTTVWVYVLFVGFVHVSVLAAVTFRWLLMGDAVKELPPVTRRARGPRPPLLAFPRLGGR